MVRRALRSRSLKRTQMKVPGGRNVTHYRRRNPNVAKCSCGMPLSGIPRLRPSEFKKLSKSKRRPGRPYGGNLCSKCSREIFREKVRKL
ncbi:MAG: 50S ribosomal protein L34e [Candidatus Aenigmarchaeota archaeon CG_4_10_14_0_8_um_filter_37_24]|nr:50S ribosomal protein L34e [Candidatus Aenigmarchaeota archaeon]OIN88534.1 MAG: 50S ribosomal protein L34e [Candidatus Aenigmarchaeota archaeon CG1_02_38_14]PIV68877.1 MAG: 50S ribosomal protein L34e [Candidatus Aenigmarchaeota archaeon CG01_land_8_20_14_3_00_37_9]PIW41076.1 MAG: 50S ribosomal protein L34e [Candidatus Aenigmarchaeota archaeon CG15_BIG_FIL_POST_REV_8_21_14_020_37_27]PIX50925.1 MAG: 50S ribosomal protein L34e [Candidatus Aenigmarchaeota archaeon CG_4_8_14_3_um_filter_37_24]PI